jgi:hypothetical protein
MANNFKVEDSIWFTNASGTVGIVKVLDYGVDVYYIAHIAHPTTQEQDAEFVANYGSTFPRFAGQGLFRG